MDKKVTTEVEDIQFHQQTVETDEHSPLHLIREKEMEISGRVLRAKRQADEIVADARKDAAAMLSTAHDEASQESVGLEATVQAELEQESAKLRSQADQDAEVLVEALGARRPDAVKYVIDSVVSA